MHLAFVDIVYDYTADRPESGQPLGGTTSGICFLAREMKKVGIECTFFNKIKQPAEAHGIPSLPLEALADERANPAYSAFIFGGRWVEWLGKLIREKTSRPLIGWMQESQFNPELVPSVPAFDGIVFNSEWQKRVNQPFVLPHWKQTVIRNAMNPRFADLFGPDEPILAAKTKPPVLIYSGVTPRGSFHLPAVLDALRPRRADFSMEIFCDCTPSRDPKANVDYIGWMKSLPNVAHVGMVGQTELAQRMKRGALLVSPNPWPETSCIALIEAMAAGLCAITTNRAVLPETGEGFAQHIEIEDPDHPLRFDMPMPYEKFAAAIDRTMSHWLNEPEEVERALRKQIDHFRARYQWAQRVKPWVKFIESVRC
jgi:glycosyltransferase involved in cell wall biosynthesis